MTEEEARTINLNTCGKERRLEFRELLRAQGFFKEDSHRRYWDMFRQNRVGLGIYYSFRTSLSLFQYLCILRGANK